jgi:hypothetical protein
MSLKNGDVLHVTRYGDEWCNMWVLVTEDADLTGFMTAAMLICGKKLPSNRNPSIRDLSMDENDADVFTKPDEWPDEVYAKLAELRLKGEI